MTTWPRTKGGADNIFVGGLREDGGDGGLGSLSERKMRGIEAEEAAAGSEGWQAGKSAVGWGSRGLKKGACGATVDPPTSYRHGSGIIACKKVECGAFPCGAL